MISVNLAGYFVYLASNLLSMEAVNFYDRLPRHSIELIQGSCLISSSRQISRMVLATILQGYGASYIKELIDPSLLQDALIEAYGRDSGQAWLAWLGSSSIHFSSKQVMNQPAYYQPQSRTEKERLRALDFEEEFKIKAYTKSELADIYGVHLNTLAVWINRHYDKFAELGYHRRLKMLDPAMVKLFISIFSTP
jgi:hypothetical protein